MGLCGISAVELSLEGGFWLEQTAWDMFSLGSWYSFTGQLCILSKLLSCSWIIYEVQLIFT